MQEKIFYYSKRKAVVRIVIALAILILCSKLVFTAISVGEISRIGLLLFVGLIGLGAALYVIISIPVLIFKPRKEIEISEKGIFSSDSDNSAMGLIPWDNISQVTLNKIENKSYICVHVHDSSVFIYKVRTKERRALLESSKIALLIDNRNVNEELFAIFTEVEQYFKKFANNTQ
jgi:NADH:ubiquinone oxidoreductase subunit K